MITDAAGGADDKPLNVVEIFGIPDLVTFTPDGRWVLTAKVASLSTPGSVNVLEYGEEGKELSLRLADISGFDLSNFPAGVRYVPGLDVARSLAPKYAAVSSDSRPAAVTLEANNAIAMVDIQNAMVVNILPLGRKHHSLVDNGFVAFDGVPGSNALDPSDKDGGSRSATLMVSWVSSGSRRRERQYKTYGWTASGTDSEQRRRLVGRPRHDLFVA